VIHGNYDMYERLYADPDGLRAGSAAGPAAAPKKDEPRRPAPKAKRKRRFPFRKVEELESEIAGLETKVRELERLMASPELYRDGEQVKATTTAFEETKARLKHLYEHWEEAVELN